MFPPSSLTIERTPQPTQLQVSQFNTLTAQSQPVEDINFKNRQAFFRTGYPGVLTDSGNIDDSKQNNIQQDAVPAKNQTQSKFNFPQPIGYNDNGTGGLHSIDDAKKLKRSLRNR